MRLLLLLLLAGCVDFDRLGTLYEPLDLGSDQSLADFDLQMMDLSAGDL